MTLVSPETPLRKYFHLDRSGSKLVKVSSDTVYSLGFDFIVLPTFFFAFLLIAAFSFLAFVTASVFIFSFSFLINSFLAFSVSISFTILKFSSVVIQNDLKTFFLIVIFLVKVGIVIRSSKEKLLPILKNFIYICRRLVQNIETRLLLHHILLFTSNHPCFACFD